MISFSHLVRRGVVVIVSDNIPQDRGFESRHGVRFLGHYIYDAMLVCVLHLHCYCVY
jgi:hypothetical protein